MTELSAAALGGKIHSAGRQLVLAITGGGSRAIAELLEVPGGSRTLLEAVVPYSAAAQSNWLGGEPEHFCSPRTARAMALAAFLRAERLDASDQHANLIGIGCTASLVSDRPKRGPHRLHVAWQSSSATVTYSLELTKGHRTRREEEGVAASLILNAVAESCDLNDRMRLDLLPSEQPSATRTDAPSAWQELLLGLIDTVRQIGTTAEPASPQTTDNAIFPGAFNPLHDGHQKMAAIAAELLGVPVEFEISIENVEKPPLDFTEMDERAAQFSAGETLWFTWAPTFVRKAELFPGATFLVGVDTLRRIADPRFYGNDRPAVDRAISQIAGHGAKFLVFGRLADGRFQTLDDLQIPPSLRQLCQPVPAERFRLDICSTDLRRPT